MGARNSVVVPARWATKAGGIASVESVPGLRASLKIPALLCTLNDMEDGADP
jgi:hypothetical protein